MKINFRVIAVIVAITATLFILCSCNASRRREDKAYRFFRENTNKLAELCANSFPVKDSIGKPVVSYKPANNTDYTPILDSLNSKISEMTEQLNKPVVSLEDCRERVDHYKNQALDWRSKFDQFKADYKKCKPDTVFKEIAVYRENAARIADLNFKLATEHDLRIIAEAQRDNYQKRYKTFLAISVVLGALLGIVLFLLFKK